MPESTATLRVHWRAASSMVNLRCDVHSARAAIATALGLALPEKPNTTVHQDALRIIWIGPDEWLVFSHAEDALALETRLREALAGQHFAVTDVSSYYQLLRLAGAPARAVLAQGCPLDLHPRVFSLGQCAGSHYFKALVWLWQSDEKPGYEILVRRSFAGYVGLMLERASVGYVLMGNDQG